jgi:hypothetical protein
MNKVKVNKKRIIIISLLFFTNDLLNAQDSKQTDFLLDFEYVTEIQSDFGAKYNWVNLFTLSAGLPTAKINPHWTNGNFRAEFISVNKIRKERIANDLMTFSNIEEDNLTFNLFILGYAHRWGNISLFGGLRNVNNDYFITPYTTLFTNSSAGIFPTISINFPLANYPLSAMCLHLEYEPTKNLLFKSSLYNGVAHDPRKNVFRSFTVNPRHDGIFSISELSCSQNKIGDGTYSLGFALQLSNAAKQSAYTSWLTVEQSLYRSAEKEIGCIVHAGIAPQFADVCRYYYAIGSYASGLAGGRNKMGIYMNATSVSGVQERTVEITWQFQIIDAIAIQPTYDYIRTGDISTNIGLLRVIFFFAR